MAKTDSEGLSAIADRLLQACEGQERLTVGNMIHILDTRSHYSLILVIAALATTPLSGIPGVSVISGLLIALIAAERIISKEHVYLPGWLRRRSLESGKIRKTLKVLRPGIDWLDRHTHRRMTALIVSPLNRLPLLLCLLCGLAMPFLELIPFTSSIVAGGVTLISVGMITRDGLFVSLSLIPFACLAYILFRIT